MIFSSSGDYGDVLYQLATVRYFGGGDICLFPSPATSNRMTPQRADIIAPLLRTQPYVSSVEWSAVPKGLNLDQWRRPGQYQNNLNLADNVANYFGVPFSATKEPWLFVEPNPIAEVVFSFGPRWRNKKVCWRNAVEVYRGASVFLGLPEEHEAFCRTQGEVPFFATANMLQVAEIVAGAKLVNCSQSSVRAIAEGLKRPVVVEQCPSCPNTHWERANASYR